MTTDEIKAAVSRYLLENVLEGSAPGELTDTTPLITGGILDSVGTLTLVSFLEETFGVEIRAFEVTPDYLDTVDAIAHLVASKRT